MLLAVAALLLHPLAIPQNLIAPVATLASSAGAASPAPEDLLLPEFDLSGVTFMPGRTTPEAVSPTAVVTVIVVPVPADSAAPAEPAEIPAVRPRVATEERIARQRRMWLGLSMAQHGAATFDAWSTRRAITSGAGRELNPMLRPFAGNASLYAAIQVGPLAFDYVARRMMTSRYGWMRHTWWVPQTLGTAMLLASGAHNLTLRTPH